MEFKTLEKHLTVHPTLVGWIMWASLKHQHIMVLITKLGAMPYYIDIRRKRLWFKKVLRGG